jgi:POT family proton-dependent oligopeptide transporter
VTPLFGAYIADTYLGRYKTITYAIFIIIFGHIILIISAIPGVIEKPGAIGAFAVAIIIIGIGTGGFKSNISPLIAEQYKRSKPFIKTLKSGERVIVDPAITVSRIYMVCFRLSLQCNDHLWVFSISTSLRTLDPWSVKSVWRMLRRFVYLIPQNTASQI